MAEKKLRKYNICKYIRGYKYRDGSYYKEPTSLDIIMAETPEKAIKLYLDSHKITYSSIKRIKVPGFGEKATYTDEEFFEKNIFTQCISTGRYGNIIFFVENDKLKEYQIQKFSANGGLINLAIEYAETPEKAVKQYLSKGYTKYSGLKKVTSNDMLHMDRLAKIEFNRLNIVATCRGGRNHKQLCTTTFMMEE